MSLFDALNGVVDLPYAAFEKKLAKLEHDFSGLTFDDIGEEELDQYFMNIHEQFPRFVGDPARVRLATIGYLSHFDVLIEKYFPEYTRLFQSIFDREDRDDLARDTIVFLEHLKEILREYTHRLSEPDRYPSYTSYIQDLIQSTMIDLFFWLQDRETAREKSVPENERTHPLSTIPSIETRDPELRLIRTSLEILGDGVLEKIFFDLEYAPRTSSVDPELVLIGRYHKKHT